MNFNTIISLIPLWGQTSGSHLVHVACRSVCDWDQNGIIQSTLILRADQEIKRNSEHLLSSSQHMFSILRSRGWILVLWIPTNQVDESFGRKNLVIKDSFVDQDSWSLLQMLPWWIYKWLHLVRQVDVAVFKIRS